MPAEQQSTAGAPMARFKFGALTEKVEKLIPALRLATVRGGAILLQFASQVVVGLLAGASGLGILQLVTSWTCIVGEVIALGLPSRAMRRVAVHFEKSDTDAINNLLTQSRRKIIAGWVFLAAFLLLLLTIVYFLWPASLNLEMLWVGLAALIAAPVFALLKLYSESLKSSDKALFAITIESLASPLCLLVLCLLCWLLNATLVAVSLVAAFVASLFIGSVSMRLALREQLARVGGAVNSVQSDCDDRPKRNANSDADHKDLFFLWTNSVLSIAFLHMPFLMMPLYMTTADIGVFSIAHKLINVVTTLLLLMAAIFGPLFARAAASNNRDLLMQTLRKTQIVGCVVFIPASVFLVLFATPLGALFGEEFAQLQWYLLVLCVGQLVNAATGLSGVLLNMTGFAAKELNALALAILFAVAGSLWLGPLYGAQALVIVFSASVALKNIASYFFARRALHHVSESL